MPKSPSNQPVLHPIIGGALTNAKRAAVLLLALALIEGPAQMLGQSSQQQEQQQREQQQREQQQREQQQRDQQQREQQQREQQQREQQQREQQQRDQQQRDQQQRESQERLQQQQHTFSNSGAATSNGSSEAFPASGKPAATDIKRATSEVQPLGSGRKIDSAPDASATAVKGHGSGVGPDLRRSVCEDGPCKTPAPKPVQLQPVASDLERKCKNGPCQSCPVGQSADKNGSCVPVPAARTVVQQPCAAGQVWNGVQCQTIGAQQCMAGQSRVGGSCQDCAITTASAGNIIVRVRSARQTRDEICLKNSTGKECLAAEADYDLIIAEYRNFLAGVPLGCEAGLPDPIAI
jgi:hypothetical protein